MSDLRIVPLGREAVERGAEVLSKAFLQDPLFLQMFKDHGNPKNMKAFFLFILYKSLLLKELLLGVELEGQLVGIASIELPTSITGAKLLLSPAFLYQIIMLMLQIPGRSFAFINQYMKRTSAARPKASHHYLVFIGVDPNHQRKGIGRYLLKYIDEIVERDTASIGIGLDTENPENVAFYEYLGYKKVKAVPLEAITLYCMFRTKP